MPFGYDFRFSFFFSFFLSLLSKLLELLALSLGSQPEIVPVILCICRVDQAVVLCGISRKVVEDSVEILRFFMVEKICKLLLNTKKNFSLDGFVKRIIHFQILLNLTFSSKSMRNHHQEDVISN